MAKKPKGDEIHTRDGNLRKRERRPRCTKIELEIRVNEFAKQLAHGARRPDLVRYAAEQWGLCERSADKYIHLAYQALKKDYDLDRSEMVAYLLSQVATLQQEARLSKNLNVALGCVNSAAKIAALIS